MHKYIRTLGVTANIWLTNTKQPLPSQSRLQSEVHTCEERNILYIYTHSYITVKCSIVAPSTTNIWLSLGLCAKGPQPLPNMAPILNTQKTPDIIIADLGIARYTELYRDQRKSNRLVCRFFRRQKTIIFDYTSSNNCWFSICRVTLY